MNQPSSKSTHSVTESAPIEVITLDCDHILTHAGGDPEILIQLCSVFLSELPVRMDSLRCAMKGRNQFLTERALQQLSNCLLVFGPGPIPFTLETLESAIRGGHVRLAQREWKCLASQVQLLVPQVQRLMLEMATPKSAIQ